MSKIGSLEQLLGKEHHDIEYLKQEQISSVLCQALSKTFMAQPNDPVQFFSRYLLNHVDQQKVSAEVRIILAVFISNHFSAQAVRVSIDQAQMRSQHKMVEAAENATKAEHAEVQAKVTEEKQAFFGDLDTSEDLNDKLQHLADFLKEHTGATGCYIGYLQYPEKEIEDDALDTDHLD